MLNAQCFQLYQLGGTKYRFDLVLTKINLPNIIQRFYLDKWNTLLDNSNIESCLRQEYLVYSKLNKTT